MAWTPGDKSGSETLTPADHLYETHINELRVASDLKAPKASPAFTGVPTAPTAAQGTNTTQLATTAFTRAEIAALIASAPGTLDTLDELAAALGDDSNFASTVATALALKAIIAGDLAGTPSVPRVKSREATAVIGPSTSFADYICPGTSDHTMINTGLNAATNAKAVLRAGTYDIQGLINPKDGNLIQGEGYGTLLQLGSDTGKTMKLQTLSHVTLRDFRIDGTNIANNNAFGMFVDQCDDVTIDHVWVLNCNGFGIFLSTAGATERGKIRVINSYITGQGNADVLGGGPSDATGVLSELIITGNYIAQGVGATPGTYTNAIDIVAQVHTVIEHNETQGGILLGGEKIPHLNVSVSHNIIRPSVSNTYGRIAILCSSNAGESGDSKGITVDHNHITAGHIYFQGQSATTNRTRKVVISNNTIDGLKTDPETEVNWGIDLNYLADVEVHDNIIDGSDRGIYINDVVGIDVSNNRFINCNTPIVFGPQGATGLTGHNNVGINPDVMYAQGNVTGATTFARVNGQYITAVQTGNITVALTDTIFKGELMTLDITTAGFSQTWPANLKLVGGALAMTGRSLLTVRWDGTNWIEQSRSIAVA